MTNEEAIMVLGMVDAYGLADDAKKAAIKALEKQIPQKPNMVISSCIGDYFYCPICGEYEENGRKYIREAYKANPYCPHCGQAIDWSEDD